MSESASPGGRNDAGRRRRRRTQPFPGSGRCPVTWSQVSRGTRDRSGTADPPSGHRPPRPVREARDCCRSYGTHRVGRARRPGRGPLRPVSIRRPVPRLVSPRLSPFADVAKDLIRDPTSGHQGERGKTPGSGRELWRHLTSACPAWKALPRPFRLYWDHLVGQPPAGGHSEARGDAASVVRHQSTVTYELPSVIFR